MRVALDAHLAVGTATGIGEYVRGLVPALAACGIDVVPLREPRLDPWRFDRRVIWDQVLLPLAAARAHADLLHCASGTLPVWAGRLPLVATVHDVAWHRFARHARPYARVYFRDVAAWRYRAARAIVTDSRFSRDELTAAAGVDPSRIFVAHLGVDAAFAGVVRRPASGPPTILAVGTVERRKALAVVVEAVAAIPGARLISVGPTTPYERECRDLARRLGAQERIEFRGYVSRDELLTLYATATCAVAPSQYEGFGYAAAQALCAGIPLLVSDAASHPEVVAGAAPLVPAGDPAAWRDALTALLAQAGAAEGRAASVRRSAVERFSWAACARATIAAYAFALGQ